MREEEVQEAQVRFKDSLNGRPSKCDDEVSADSVKRLI